MNESNCVWPIFVVVFFSSVSVFIDMSISRAHKRLRTSHVDRVLDTKSEISEQLLCVRDSSRKLYIFFSLFLFGRVERKRRVQCDAQSPLINQITAERVNEKNNKNERQREFDTAIKLASTWSWTLKTERKKIINNCFASTLWSESESSARCSHCVQWSLRRRPRQASTTKWHTTFGQMWNGRDVK